MFMGYIYITCHECSREVKHHSRDVISWPTRICPGCGTRLEVCIAEQTEEQQEKR